MLPNAQLNGVFVSTSEEVCYIHTLIFFCVCVSDDEDAQVSAV